MEWLQRYEKPPATPVDSRSEIRTKEALREYKRGVLLLCLPAPSET
jgi:hypothetical protein